MPGPGHAVRDAPLGSAAVLRPGGTLRLLGAAVIVLALAGCIGRTRYNDVDGPLKDAVVFPDEFGVDVRGLPVDVGAALSDIQLPRLRADVDAIDEPRGTAQYAAALRAAGYVAGELDEAGLDVHFDNVTADNGQVLPNVVADIPGTGCSDRVFVIGAHYDSVNATPGADDNASGVAGMLELARVLQARPLPMTVRFIGFAFEEIGLLGSRQAATQLADAGVEVVGMVALEMIGFTAKTDDSFLGVPNDYVASVGDPQSEYLARVFGAAHYEYLLGRFAPAAVIDPAALGDILRSDHAPFWAAGFPALLVTDTANFRNPNYHRETDTRNTLDFGYLADSTKATLAGVLAYGLVDADDDRTPDVCA
jgi:Zn-dependent M28 family amino/carboxypeptidase